MWRRRRAWACRASKAGDWESPISYAQKNGARALILVPRNFERRWRYGAMAITRASYSVPRLQNLPSDDEEEDDEAAAAAPAQGLVSIIPSRAMLNTLFAGEQLDGAAVLRLAQDTTGAEQPKAFALSPDKRLSLSLKLSVTEAYTQNVVAVLEGKDSKLKREYVALGAHYDHVGASGAAGCRPNGADTVCNGADDDGSGTTGLLTMAEAFSKGPRPRRSILFVWHTGEEKGLWGSEYFTRYPTVPLNQIVAQLNIDMIGRSKKEGDTNPANRMLTGPERDLRHRLAHDEHAVGRVERDGQPRIPEPQVQLPLRRAERPRVASSHAATTTTTPSTACPSSSTSTASTRTIIAPATTRTRSTIRRCRTSRARSSSSPPSWRMRTRAPSWTSRFRRRGSRAERRAGCRRHSPLPPLHL